MKLTLITLIILTSIIANAQLNLSGELRPRFEFRDGYKGLKIDSLDPGVLISQRSRINFSFKKDFYKTYISFQDVRVWGSEQQKKNQINLTLHEAWVEIFVNKDFSIKTGRQVLIYDNQRLIAGSNWNQIGQKHDAINEAISNFEEYISSQTLAKSIILTEKLKQNQSKYVHIDNEIKTFIKIDKVII